MSLKVKGSDAFARGMSERLPDPLKRERATENYTAGRELLAQPEQGAKLSRLEAGLNLAEAGEESRVRSDEGGRGKAAVLPPQSKALSAGALSYLWRVWQ